MELNFEGLEMCNFADQNIMQRDPMELNFERLEMQNEIYQWIELKD